MSRMVWVVSFLALAGASGTAFSDTDITGTYKRPNGTMVKIDACGKAFCVTAQSKPYVGQSVGELASDGSGNFKGSLTDPSNGKTYTGKASAKGSTLSVAGCVLGGLICKSENWQKQ